MASGKARVWVQSWCVQCQGTETTRLRLRRPKGSSLLTAGPVSEHRCPIPQGQPLWVSRSLPAAAWQCNARCSHAPAARPATALVAGCLPRRGALRTAGKRGPLDQSKCLGAPLQPRGSLPWSMGSARPTPGRARFEAGSQKGEVRNPETVKTGEHRQGASAGERLHAFPEPHPVLC